MKKLLVLLVFSFLLQPACSRVPPPLKLAPNMQDHAPVPWGKAAFYSQSRRITSILVTDDHLWAGTPHGLQQWTLEGNRHQIISSRDGLPDDHIHSLTMTTTGSVWVATAGGLSSWTNGAWQNHPLPIEGEPTVVAATVTGDAVWAGTTKGLAFQVFGRWVVYSSRVHVTTLKPNATSGVWLGTRENGVFFCENGACKPRPSPLKEVTAIDMEGDDIWIAGLTPQKEPLFLLIRNDITHVYDAPGPIKWIQRYMGSVFMNFQDSATLVQPCSKDAKHTFVARTQKSPCLEAVAFAKPLPMRITSLFRTGGNLWVGTENLGITRYTENDMQQYTSDDLVDPHVMGMSLECVPAGRRCYFAAGKNSFIYEHEKGFSPILLPDHPGWSLASFATNTVGGLFAAAISGTGTVSIFQRQASGQWQPVPDTPSLETQDPNVRVRFSHFTQRHIAWIGVTSSKAASSGIFIYNMERNRINGPRNYRDLNGRRVDVPESVKTLYRRKDIRYLATNQGLVLLYRKDGKKIMEKVSAANGLHTDIVEDVLVEPSGWIWLATDLGICLQKSRNDRWLCGVESPMPDAAHTTTLVRDPQTGTVYAGAGNKLFRYRNHRTEMIETEKHLNQERIMSLKIDINGILWVLHPESLSLIQLESR